MAREINAVWDRHGTIYGTTSALVFVCIGGGVTLGFLFQILSNSFGENLEIKCRTESLSLSYASLVPRPPLAAAFRLQPGEPRNEARAMQFTGRDEQIIGGPPGF